MCLLYQCRWGFCFQFIHMQKWFHSYRYMKMTKYIFFDMQRFYVHKVTFRYIGILQNYTFQ